MMASENEGDGPRIEPKWRRYLRLIRPNHVADLDDELRDHIESTTEALIARGWAPAAARAEAMRRFGDVAKVRSEVQRMDSRHYSRGARLATMETLLYDLRHAVRGLRRSPVFTFTAAISIALGVAANATVFSAVNALLFRPIPGTHAPRLVRVYVNHHSPFDWRDLSWLRDHTTSFEHIIGERYSAMSFRGPGSAENERVLTSYVTQGFFSGLGVRASLGRVFEVSDTSAATEPVAVLSYAFWQRRFGGDSSVIGRRIALGDHLMTIVGVLPSDFRSSVMMWAPDVIIPFSVAPILTGRRLAEFGGSFYTTARLRPGVTMDAAGRELRLAMTRLARTDSLRHEGMTLRLDHTRGVNAELRQGVAAGSVFVMAMVALVLLIACANVANLLLGRAAARRTEIGVRLAIGASRARLVGQLLTESMLLALFGGALGFVAAWALTRTLGALLPAEANLDSTFFAPDSRVLLFTASICVLSALLFGAAPALRSASPNLVTLLKGGDEDRRRRKRGALVAVQSAMCVLLLAVASLFLRSLASMRGVDPGFRAENVVDVTVDLGLRGERGGEALLFEQLRKRAADLPGAGSATLTAVVPLSGSNMETRLAPEGSMPTNRRDYLPVYFNIIGPRYFSTLRTPILRGREFLETDDATAPRVAVLSASASRRIWPNGDALGKRFHWGAVDGPLVQVVGVVADADYVMPGEDPKTVVYVPAAQEPRSDMTLLVRTTADVGTVRRAAWQMLHEMIPALPPAPVARMSEDMAITLLPVKLGAGVLGAFGAVALLLAAAGIYGVAAYSVARRTREIGVRAALGATRSRLIGMVLWESGKRVGIGAAIGVALTVVTATGLSRVLYGVRALDPIVLVGVVVLITAVAVLASLAPARRAARADPVAAMRSD